MLYNNLAVPSNIIYNLYMVKVKKEFIRTGFTFKQIIRVGQLAIFAQSKPNWKIPRYEVVRINKHNGYKIGTQFVKAAETYPGASLWGMQGWTFFTLEKAEKKFKELGDRFNSKSLKVKRTSKMTYA